jgi:large subunit ribosomal protein L28
MAHTCDICGRGTLVGFNVSHAHNKTKKRQQANLRSVRLTHSGTSTVSLRVCADDLKELKRRGLLLRWKDLAENQPKEKPAQPVAKINPKPKKATPKAKKEAKAKKADMTKPAVKKTTKAKA